MASSDDNRSESPLHLPEPSSPQGPVTHALAPVGNSSAYGAPVPVSPLPPGLAAPPDMKSLLKALKRHWLLATTLGIVAATAASAAAWYFMPAKYTVEIVLGINTTKLVNTGNDKEGASPFSPLTISNMPKLRYVVRQALDDKEVAKLPSVREQFDQVDWLRKGLQVTYLSPELLMISLSGNNPRELETLVTAVANVYTKVLGDEERNVRQVRANKLGNVINRLQTIIKQKRETYRGLVENSGAKDAAQRQNQTQFYLRRLDRLLADKVVEQVKLERLGIALQQNKDRKNDQIRVRGSQVMAELKQNPAVVALKTRIAALQEDLTKAEPVYRDPNHNKLVERRETIQKAKDDLKALEKKLVLQIQQDLTELNQLLGDDNEEDIKIEIKGCKLLLQMMDVEIDRLGNEIKKEGPESLALEEMKAEFSAEDAVVDSLRKQKVIWDAEHQDSPSSAKIQDPAVAFADQNVKKQIMIAGGAGGGALALVLFVIAYWEFRVRRINTADDVVYGLGWRLVGQLPPLPDRSPRGLLRKNADPRYWQSLMTESVDATRTMILHAARAEGLRTVMVTSAVSGEGKTSLSCHLACSLARAGRKTLLLDCDMRNPAAHRLFELPAEPGICEVLRGEAQLADVIRATPATNLWLIPAGQFDEQALQTFTLSQDRFSPLLEQLKAQFDFIVIDSSPVLPVVDTLVIGQNVDVVVFSLLRDVSRIPSVYAAYQRLTTLGIRILGAVVNGVDTGAYGYTPQYAKQTV